MEGRRGQTKGLMKVFSGGWFAHVERMENGRLAQRVYVGECAGSRSVGRLRKRWMDTLKECLRKRGLDYQASKENGAR